MKNALKSAAFILSISFLMAGCSPLTESFSPDPKKDGDQNPKREVRVNFTVGFVDDGRGGPSGRGPGGSPGSGSGRPGDGSGGSTDTPGDGYRGGGHDGDGGAASRRAQVDIFFYLGHKKVGNCWSYLSHSIEKTGFLSHINKKLNWQVSMAFSSRPEIYLFRRRGDLPLVRDAGFLGFGGKRIYVLKRGDIGGYLGYKSLSEADESLGWTIANEYYRRPRYDVKEPKMLGDMVFPPQSWPPVDPLSGLNNLLEDNPRDFVRSHAKTFVVLLEYGKYRYTQQEWSNFARQHKGIHFINLSSRKGAVSDHAGLDWIPCGYSDVAHRLAEYIQGHVLN